MSNAYPNRRELLRVYTRSDACGAAKTWARYLGASQEELRGIAVYGDPGLAEAVRRDMQGIGYNNINFAYDARTKQPVPGLAILPVDVNGNGVLDKQEDFYGSRDALTAAIARGDYPAPPARDLFLVARGKPSRRLQISAITWVLPAVITKSGLTD